MPLMTPQGLLRLPLLLALFALGGAVPASAGDLPWVATWYASPSPGRAPTAVLQDVTVREIVHTSAGGKAVRIRLSNAYGTKPVRLDDVQIALRDTGAGVRAGSSVRLTFQGSSEVSIAPGAFVLSDPVAFDAPEATDLAVSLHVPGPAAPTTAHDWRRNAVYVASGDVSGAATITPIAAPGGAEGILWLDEVEVAGGKADRTVVAFGDSITDGVGPEPDSNATWPDVLYARLRAAKIERFSIANAGIGGNRLLHDGMWPPFGATALARFDRDVLAQPNVKAVILLIGINDIGQVGAGAPADETVTAEDLERALSQLAERAHERGIKVYAGTLTPFKPTAFKGYYDDQKDVVRQAVNRWIRSAKVFDGVADFDKALEDPAAPGQMRAAFDSVDHLHPSAAGDRAIAEAIPLGWFR
jgi:lysophospholipase L1-like esterase